jgi:NAD(P)-dependent dehydrogenase (short-subunit alcohol dehydrogenase family)
MAMKMTGKVVLITGGAQGIGLCTAERFAKAGSYLVLTDLNEAALATAKEKLAGMGPGVDTYVVNVADRDQVEAMFAQVKRDHGAVDVLINNAGVGHMGALAETTLATWEKLAAVNLWGPLYHIYAVLPEMIERGGGHIVNVSSGQAFLQLPSWGAYSAIKTALGVFSEVLHWEMRKHDVKVTTVYPYMVNTGLYDGIEGDTFMSKMAMRLMPYYSQSPETVGKIIFNAVRKNVRVENVSVMNSLIKAMKFVSPVGNTVSWFASEFLTPDHEEAAKAKR